MDLRSLRTRINALLEAQGPDGPPEAIIVMPDCGRGPDADADKPLPRVGWRNAKAALILYDAAVGRPDAEIIRALIDGTVQS